MKVSPYDLPAIRKGARKTRQIADSQRSGSNIRISNSGSPYDLSNRYRGSFGCRKNLK
jgi:hypothetical protein